MNPSIFTRLIDSQKLLDIFIIEILHSNLLFTNCYCSNLNCVFAFSGKNNYSWRGAASGFELLINS